MSAASQNHVLTRRVALCAIYLRISLDSTGQGLGVARQKTDCERIARERGWAVFDTYEDNSVSAFDRAKRRPAYERMVADFAAGKFTAIVCWDLDRLTRQPRQLEDWVDAAEQRGLVLVTANGDADLGTDGGRMYARIKAAVARGEMERKSARQKAANAQRFERGLLYGGTRVTGYTSTGEVVEAEAEIVRRIFDAFEHGDSVKSITDTLQRDGVATRTGRPWSRSTVTDMLRNPKYAGRQTINRQATGKAGNWVALVKDSHFDAVQVRFEDPDRKRMRKGTDRRYLGSGLFLCGVCQREVQIYGNGPTYGCPKHLYKAAHRVDDLVQEALVDRLSRPDVIEMLSPRDDERLRALSARSTEMRRRLLTIEADYDAGLIDGKRYAVASGRVRADLTEVEQERAALLAGDSVGAVLTAADPGQRYRDAALPVQRAVLDALLLVVLLPNPAGSKKFFSDTVSIRWRRTFVTWNDGFVHVPEVDEHHVAALAVP